MGCGPSGLVAAKAAQQFTTNIHIWSKKRKSEMFGAQYLHGPIPEVDCGEQHNVVIKFLGDAEGYRDKVYGPDYRGLVSPSEFQDDHPAWDIRQAYDKLWDEFEPKIGDFTLSPKYLLDLNVMSSFAKFDAVFSTIPRKKLCYNPEHEFKSTTVYAIGDAPERGVRCPVSCGPFTLVYNGSPDYAWYRKSNIFGYTTAEWPAPEGRRKPPLAGLAEFEKPISTTCTCFPNFYHIGRYGAWRKGVLVHQVYDEVIGILQRVQGGVQSALF